MPDKEDDPGNDDYWKKAVDMLTGYVLPPRDKIFDDLKGNEGIPMMHVRFDSSGTQYISGFSGDSGWRAKNTDYVIPFYVPVGDGDDVTGRSLSHWWAYITILGTLGGDDDEDPKPPSGDDNYSGYEGESGVLKDEGDRNKDGKAVTWDTRPLAQYVHGSNAALSKLNYAPYSTWSFEDRGISVPDSAYVDLTSFTDVAKSFDRVVNFFKSSAEDLKNWDEQQIGEDGDSWTGTGASLFKHLIHKLNRNYEGYVEQLEGEGESTAKPSLDGYTATSSVGRALIDLQSVIKREVGNLKAAWDAWRPESRPQRWLYDMLQQVLLEVLDRQHAHTDIEYSYSPGYGPGVMYVVAESGFEEKIKIPDGKNAKGETIHWEVGSLQKIATWKEIGDEAARRWDQSVRDWLSSQAAKSIVEIEKAFDTARNAFDADLTDRDTRSLDEIATKEQNEKDRRDAAKDREDARNEAEEAKAQAEKDRAEAKAQAEKDRAEAKAQAEADRAEAKAQAEKDREEAKAYQDEQRAQAEKDRAEAKAQAEKDREEAKAYQDEQRAQAEKDREEAKAQAEQERAEVEKAQEEAKQQAEQERTEAQAQAEKDRAEAKAYQDEQRAQAEQDRQNAIAQNNQVAQQQQRERDKAEREREAAQAEAEKEREEAKAQAEKDRAEAEAQAEKDRAEAEKYEDEQREKVEKDREEARAYQEEQRAQAEKDREEAKAQAEADRSEAEERAEQERQDARREQTQARYELEQEKSEAREEYERAIEEARGEQDAAERDADRQVSEARKEYDEARAEAQEQREKAQEQAEKERAQAKAEYDRQVAEGRTSVADARAEYEERLEEINAREQQAIDEADAAEAQAREEYEQARSQAQAERDAARQETDAARRDAKSDYDQRMDDIQSRYDQIGGNQDLTEAIRERIASLPTFSDSPSTYSPYAEDFGGNGSGQDGLAAAALGREGAGNGAGQGGYPPPMMPPNAGGNQGNNGERSRQVLDSAVNRVPTRGQAPSVDQDNVVVRGMQTTSGVPFMPPMAGGGQADGNQSTTSGDRERSTWLTEEEDVWGTDEGGAPQALGR